jgi:hypothetical protein
MPVKLFTLAEATHLLPEVRRLMEQAQEAVRSVLALQDRLSVLEVLDAGEPQNPEHAEFRRTQDALEEAAAAFNQRLEELHQTGCVLKDLNHGLVDFYSRKDGRLIFLCWRTDEPAIGFWHELDGGLAGRHPVAEI